jgi:hypothetical protein
MFYYFAVDCDVASNPTSSSECQEFLFPKIVILRVHWSIYFLNSEQQPLYAVS